ncbi:MAG: FAD:protein FMN transferase [Armatimonadetes bacterium]|nr:FAD:protein FMN transferase [Armatimonadota bacterium]
MATRFELMIEGDNSPRLRAVGEEALSEIARLDAQLSIYRADSEVSDLNARAQQEPVKLDPRTFNLLKRATELSRLTGGAFEITVLPLLRCWGLAGGCGTVPPPEEIMRCLRLVGVEQLRFNDRACTVQFRQAGVQVDLGAIGKGYAVDRACSLMRENGIRSMLLNGGLSSVAAMGSSSAHGGWRVGIQHPTLSDKLLTSITLMNETLSVSAVHGKSFYSTGRRFGHIIDPRTGRPVENRVLAAVISPSATDGDALSTALLTLGAPGLDHLKDHFPSLRALVVVENEGKLQTETLGIEL